MLRIRTYNNISVKGLERFSREKYEVASDISNPDAFLLRSQKLHDEPLPESLRAIARAGAGTNNVPVEKCSKQGIVVFNTPGANANAVKELVATGLLLSSRGIIEGSNYTRSCTDISDHGEFARHMEQVKKQFAGSEIRGKTLGVVGLGAIGSMVANMALALGMNVIGFDPAISVEAAWKLSSSVQKAENLQSLLSKSDFVTLHVPAIDATKGMINSEMLGAFKEGAVLLNFAREEIVDGDAILTALEEKKLSRFVTDFPTPELIKRDDVIVMPHIGASTREAEENCAMMAADQLMDYLENGNIKNSVNFPQIAMERTTGHRITFSNENVPRVIGHVTSILADKNINIIDMLNKSRGELAYSILDVDSEPTEEVLDAIRQVEHVIAVRAV